MSITETIETEHGPLTVVVHNERQVSLRTLGNLNVTGSRGTFGPFWGVQYTMSADLYRNAEGKFQIGDPATPESDWLRKFLLMSRVDSPGYREATASVKVRVAKVIEQLVAVWLAQHPNALAEGELSAIETEMMRLDNDVADLRARIADMMARREMLADRKASLVRSVAIAA